jgi:DNA-directed RNA polymerase subunit K/omega
VSAPPASPPAGEGGSDTHIADNRFLLAAVAFLRSKQLIAGAAARVEREGHKPTHIAVLEVLADTISWSSS